MQGELGWVANPTEGGVSATKSVSFLGMHGPLLGKNGEIMSIIGRGTWKDPQNRHTPLLIRFSPGEDD